MHNSDSTPIDEAKKNKKKDPPLNKPTKNTGGGKKYKVYVRSKSGGIKRLPMAMQKVVLKATGTALKLVKVLPQGISALKKRTRPRRDTGLVEPIKILVKMCRVDSGN